MTEFYTPFYEWAANWDELSLPEALVLCRIKYWGNAGCFESYARLAQVLKLDRRTAIRAVTTLHEKDLIKIVRQGKYKRTIFFNFSNTNLPLFDKKVVPQRHHLKKSSVRESPKVVSESHLINHTRQDKTKEKILLTSEMMKPTKRMSNSAKEKNRQRLLKQLEDMK